MLAVVLALLKRRHLRVGIYLPQGSSYQASPLGDSSALLLAVVRSPVRAPGPAMPGEVPAGPAAPAEVPRWALAGCCLSIRLTACYLRKKKVKQFPGWNNPCAEPWLGAWQEMGAKGPPRSISAAGQERWQSSSTPASALLLLNTVCMCACMYVYINKHFTCPALW